jgi:hypothetical protein
MSIEGMLLDRYQPEVIGEIRGEAVAGKERWAPDNKYRD